MIERLTDEQKSEYIGILNYVRYKYPNADKRTWFEISSEWFMENGHDIDNEETIGTEFDEYMEGIE